MTIVVDDIEKQIKDGDFSRFGEAFSHHRPRLWQIVHFRLNDRIRTRIDVEDVLQDAYLDAEKRLLHFAERDFPSLFLWLRLVTGQTLSRIHRTHFQTESRSVDREAQAPHEDLWGNTSLCLSQRFVAHLTSPSQAVVKKEAIAKVQLALDGMSEIDREVVALRHFEELTNHEVAAELNVSPKTASIRYIRALERLRGVMEYL